MIVNPVFHASTKHIELDYHFFSWESRCWCLYYTICSFSITDCWSLYQSCLQGCFSSLHSKLGVLPPPPSSLRGTDKEIFLKKYFGNQLLISYCQPYLLEEIFWQATATISPRLLLRISNPLILGINYASCSHWPLLEFSRIVTLPVCYIKMLQ